MAPKRGRGRGPGGLPGVPSRRVSSQAKAAGRRGPGRNEEVKRSPPGKETPKSEQAAESGGPAARAHSRPRQIPWARDLRGAPSPTPSPGQPERAAARLRWRRQRSRAGAGVHTPEGQGGAGAQGLPSGAGRASGLTSAGFSSVLSRPRRPRPAPASCTQSGRGAALSSAAPRRPLLAAVRRHQPGVRLSRAVGPREPGLCPVGAQRPSSTQAPAPRVLSGR